MGWEASLDAHGRSWFARRYASLAGGGQWRRVFLPPNQFVEMREDGLSVLQVLPAGAAQCRIRWLEYHLAEADPRRRAMAYLARRLRATWLAQDIEALTAPQGSGGLSGPAAAEHAPPCPAVAVFRAARWRP